MKYFKLGSFILIMVMLTIQACYYDNPPEPPPIDPEDVSFQTHIVPILNNSCATSGCHDGSEPPNLMIDQAWASLIQGGFVNLSIPKESYLYKSVEFEAGVAGMPPGGPQIPELDRILILRWIEKGAPND